METRSNYLIVGLFFLVMTSLGVASTVWISNFGDRDQSQRVRFVFQDSVSGLDRGAAVSYNGIRVGQVDELSLDSNDLRRVLVVASIDAAIPIKIDTRAALGLVGLTGGTEIRLSGGSPSSPELSPTDGQIPEIFADPSPVQDFVAGAQGLIERANSVLEQLDLALEENRPAVARSFERIDRFTEALDSNSEGIKRFLDSISNSSGSLASLTTKIEAFVDNLDQLVSSTDGDAINKTLENIRALSATLRQSGESINAIVSKADSAASDIQEFSSRLSSSLEAITAIAEAVDPADVKRTVTAITGFSESLTSTRVLVDDVLLSAKSTIEDFRGFSNALNDASPDIAVISDTAKEITERIAGIGEKVERLLVRLENSSVLGEDTSVVEEVSGALAAVRDAAETIRLQTNQLSSGAGRSLQDVQALVRESRNSISRIERVISNFESNPQRFLFGNSGVREFNDSGRALRR